MPEVALESVDLSPEQLTIVQNILLEHVPDKEVRAFGSRVNGSARTFSDLDLAVIGDTPLTMNQLGLLRTAFDKSLLPWTVDIVDWSTTSDRFREIIKSSYAILQRPIE